MLNIWARNSLHRTFIKIIMKGRGFFEVIFNEEIGKIHTLNTSNHKVQGQNITFSSWQPHLDALGSEIRKNLNHTICVQVVGMCVVLKQEEVLRHIGGLLGKVTGIDCNDQYYTKARGERIRILVKHTTKLPPAITIKRLDTEGDITYELLYSGLHNQCARCRATCHQVRNCP